MTLKTSFSWQRYLMAAALIAAAAALRIWPLQALHERMAWLTFYPAVMVAAIYGGLWAGLFATTLASLTVAFGLPLLVAHPFIKDSADGLGLAVFILTGTMISSVAEGMLRANERARQAQAQAEFANQAKSIFLANMSHELRTPLNAILGFSSLMRSDSNLSEAQRKTLDIINHSGEHLLNLINNILDISKIEAGQVSIEKTAFDLAEMIYEVTDLMRIRSAEKNLELRLDQSSTIPNFIRTDSVRLRQILLNLIGNAIKFTHQGAIIVRVNTAPGDLPQSLRLMIEIEDSGVGISRPDQARIFEPFTQLNTSAMQQGTGLGLAITRQYVQLLGGQIAVQSTPGQGSIFRLQIPVEQVDASTSIPSLLKQGRVLALAPGQADIRILIVEDQPENWLLLQRILENVGFQVRVAENGALGVKTFQTWQPHFIWMDVRMPVMDGLTATRQIRALPGGQEVKIVALTASVFGEERTKILAAGMEDMIRKPYRQAEIFDCLARHLGVRYAYQEEIQEANLESGMLLRQADLAALPSELQASLIQSLVSLDIAQIDRLIQQAAAVQPALGKALSHHAGQLHYTTILQAMQQQRPDPDRLQEEGA